MSKNKTIKMLRSQFVTELANAHMQGYSQGVVNGIEIAEKLTGTDLSEAKKIVLEEAEKELKDNGNQEDLARDFLGRNTGAVDKPGSGSGREPDTADKS